MKQPFFMSIIVCSLFFISGCIGSTHKKEDNSTARIGNIEPSYNIVLPSDVEWTHLNPKRGDLAPKAGTLWGDRNSTEPTGFLLKPNDGFESPPHIHNVSYRGVVIEGYIHNDDPNAAEMWMPTGSFWTQPKGEIHITAAKGTSSLAYIEIEEGPYLVLPEKEHFDNGERPVNIEQSNIVWLNAKDLNWTQSKALAIGAKIAFLWGKPIPNELNGTFLSLPPKFSGKLITQDSPFRAIVIKGNIGYQEPKKEQLTQLPSGSFFSSEKKSYHTIINNSEQEALIYIRSFGAYKLL